MRPIRPVLFTLALLSLSLGLGADALSQERRFTAGAHFATTFQDELDDTDLGFGARLGYQLTPLLDVKGELSLYPANVPDRVTITTSRLEGLFGAKLGPRFDRFAVFAKARPGFVRFAEAPEPVACIAIFPPPLNCVLAEGRTVFALDLGGVVELYPTARSLVRVDVSNLLLRYPGPAFARDGEAFTDGALWRGNLRLAFGLGLRF